MKTDHLTPLLAIEAANDLAREMTPPLDAL